MCVCCPTCLCCGYVGDWGGSSALSVGHRGNEPVQSERSEVANEEGGVESSVEAQAGSAVGDGELEGEEDTIGPQRRLPLSQDIRGGHQRQLHVQEELWHCGCEGVRV